LFSFQTLQHTNVEGSTNALFAATQAGCKEKGRQLKVFIEFFAIKKFQNRLQFVINLCNFV